MIDIIKFFGNLISENKDFVFSIFSLLGTTVTIVAFIYAVKTIKMNTMALQQSNDLKNKAFESEKQRALYAQRLELRNKLYWLNQFAMNYVKLCGLEIKQNIHPYVINVELNKNELAEYTNDTFRHSIINELLILSGEIKVLFPQMYEEYMDYYNTLEKAYLAYDESPIPATEIWNESSEKWKKILMEGSVSHHGC